MKENADSCICEHCSAKQKDAECSEHDDIQKILIIRFTASVLLFGIAVYFSDNFYSLFIFIAAYLTAGYDVVLSAMKNIAKGKMFDENFLMTIATLGAFIIGEYPEAVAVMLFFQLGEIFQNYAVARSRRSVKALMDIRPDTANKVSNGKIEAVNAKEIKIGDIIIVKPGERVPLDGILIDGAASLDTSSLTGESLPREAAENDKILSGYIVIDRAIKICVTACFENSAVSRILALVEEASSKKSSSERFITKFAAVYTPIVVGLAALLAIVPPLFFGSFSHWFYRALTFLVISCPCALVISVPLGFFAGIGGAAKCGVLIKGANYIEILSKADTFIFDKTGTLTSGTFSVTNIKANNCSDYDLLYAAACAQSLSNHPVARAVIKKTQTLEIIAPHADRFEEIAGYGVCAYVGEDRYAAGNLALMKKLCIDVHAEAHSETSVYIAKNNIFMGYLGLNDTVKSDSAETIEKLKCMGIKQTVMLTGDKDEIARKIGGDIGIDIIHSQLLPEDKANELEKYKKNYTVAYVGDGINDAPVLAMADVGIAMGAFGSDAAIESADVVLMTDEPSKLIAALKQSRRTMSIVKQNIVLIIAVKIIIMVLGAMGYAGMWSAVLADVGVALVAIFSSMRALYVKNLK